MHVRVNFNEFQIRVNEFQIQVKYRLLAGHLF